MNEKDSIKLPRNISLTDKMWHNKDGKYVENQQVVVLLEGNWWIGHMIYNLRHTCTIQYRLENEWRLGWILFY